MSYDKKKTKSIDTASHCLSSILRYHKISIDPKQISREYAPNGAKCDTISLLRAAKELGVKARSTHVSIRRLAKQPLPAIAKDKDSLFFIIGKVEDGKILIQYPSEQPQTLSHDDFLEIWDGPIILITTRASIEENQQKFDISWFIPAIARYRKLFGEVLIASFFLQLFGLVTPLFFQVVVDKVLVHRGLTTLDVLVIGLIIITIFDVILGGLRTYIFSHTTSRVDIELGTKLFKHLLNLPLSYFQARAAGQTVARVRELENIRDFLTSSAVTVVLDLLFTVVFFTVMYYFSPILTWIVLGTIPFYVILSLAITPSLRRRIEERFQRGAVNQAFLVESISGVETLKAMAIEPERRQKWEEQLAAYVKSSFKAITLGMVGSQSVQLISRVSMAIILWFGAQLVISGELSIGQLIAFNMLSGQVNGPILRLAQLWQDFQQFRISVAKLGDVLNTPQEPGSESHKASVNKLNGKIEFEKVTFRYKSDDKDIIHNLDLKINQNQIIGIVGRSGSGKSTLTKLLQRLYVPSSGRVLIDGLDLIQIDVSWLRKQIGVVLQENVLFSGSVRDNIALGVPATSMDNITKAAKISGAHEFIAELNNGYDTILEERGSNLSGGQKQRIAIARALITSPRILIFDEATSALDYESERIIQENMSNICKGRTVLIIAHRLSTVRHTDRIIVIDRGKIIEDAPHDELIKLDGIYAHLWNQQVR